MDGKSEPKNDGKGKPKSRKSAASSALQELHLVNMERLLAHSMKGVHCLFDNSTLAKIFKTPTENLDFFSLENMDRIQQLFSTFLQKKSVSEKLLFLETLSASEYELLVRTYFHIVENSVLASSEFKH